MTSGSYYKNRLVAITHITDEMRCLFNEMLVNEVLFLDTHVERLKLFIASDEKDRQLWDDLIFDVNTFVLDMIDIDGIKEKTLRTVSTQCNQKRDLVYTTTGSIVKGYDVTILGLKPEIAQQLIISLYNDPSVEISKEFIQCWLDDFKTDRPNCSFPDFELEKTTQEDDWNNYAFRRGYLSPALIEIGEVENIDSVPVFRIIFNV